MKSLIIVSPLFSVSVWLSTDSEEEMCISESDSTATNLYYFFIPRKKCTFPPAVALCSPSPRFSLPPSQPCRDLKILKALEAWDFNLPHAPVLIKNHITVLQSSTGDLHLEHGKCCKVVAAAKSSGLRCYSCFSSVVIPHNSVKVLLILNMAFNWNIKVLSPHFRRFKPCFWLFCDLFCGGFLFIPFFPVHQKGKEASLWFGVETAQHKGKTSIPLPIWIPVSQDLLKNQTTLLSFNIFTRKVARCHCWPLPHYLKNATVPRDLLSLWWLCAPFPPFCQVFFTLFILPRMTRTELICWVDYCSFPMSVAILSLFLHCFGPMTFFGQEEGR